MAQEENWQLDPSAQEDMTLVSIDPRLLRRAAAMNQSRGSTRSEDPARLCQMGLKYLYGLGGYRPDPSAGIAYLTRAAEGGDAFAQYSLGMCYLEGNGTAKDPDQALRLFTQAAEQGSPHALTQLGRCSPGPPARGGILPQIGGAELCPRDL